VEYPALAAPVGGPGHDQETPMSTRRPLRTLLPVSLALIVLASIASPAFASDADAEAIKSLIRDSYVHGAFNELNPEAMKRGFHPDFAIFSADGEDIARYPIATWADRTAKRKADPEFDPAGNVWEHRFAAVDVTGGSAMVKIELSQDGKLVYTDYLSLLKFDSGWRIVAKVYHKH
jgi:hypothetical protein